MKIDRSGLMSSLLQHRLPSLDVLKAEVDATTSDGLNVDAFAWNRANPFMRDVLSRSFDGVTGRGQQQGPAWRAVDQLADVVLSLLADCADADGQIEENAVRERYGEAGARIFAEAVAARDQPVDHLLKNDRMLPTRLSGLDPRLVATIGADEGVPAGMPLLDQCVQHLHGDRPLENFDAVFVQHLFGGQLPFFAALEQAGLHPERTTVLGRGYSDSEVVRALGRAGGYDVRDTPKSDLGEYEAAQRTALRAALTKAIVRATEDNRKILLIDDGGMAVRMVHEEFARQAHLFCAVEQTTRGVTELRNVDLEIPVVNVARSRGKEREAPFIAEVVSEKLLFDLTAIGRGNVSGRKVAVFGYGFIGKQVADSLRALGAEVTVHDRSPEARADAAAHGFATKAHDDLSLSDYSLVLGCTGMRSIGPAQLEAMADGTIIASCSSAEVEIDNVYLSEMASRRLLAHRGAYDSNHKNYEICRGGRRLLLLNEGKPINFDGRTVGVANHKIQLTHGLLFEAALQSVASRATGLIDLDGAAQDRLLAGLDEAMAHPDAQPAAPVAAVVTTLPQLPLPGTADQSLRRTFMEIQDKARQRSDAIVNDLITLVPHYPGLDRPVIVTEEAAILLDPLEGTIIDVARAGASFLVTTVDAAGSEHLHVFDVPPNATLVTDAGDERCFVSSVETSKRRAEVTADGLLFVRSVVEMIPPAEFPEEMPWSRHRRDALVYAKGDTLFFQDLRNGEQGPITGVPTEARRLSAVAGGTALFDPIARRLYVLDAGSRRVEREIDLAPLGAGVLKLFPERDGLVICLVQDDHVRVVKLDPGLEFITGSDEMPLPPGREVYRVKGMVDWVGDPPEPTAMFALAHHPKGETPIDDNLEVLPHIASDTAVPPIIRRVASPSANEGVADRPAFRSIVLPVAAPTPTDGVVQELYLRVARNGRGSTEAGDQIIATLPASSRAELGNVRIEVRIVPPVCLISSFFSEPISIVTVTDRITGAQLECMVTAESLSVETIPPALLRVHMEKKSFEPETDALIPCEDLARQPLRALLSQRGEPTSSPTLVDDRAVFRLQESGVLQRFDRIGGPTVTVRAVDQRSAEESSPPVLANAHGMVAMLLPHERTVLLFDDQGLAQRAKVQIPEQLGRPMSVRGTPQLGFVLTLTTEDWRYEIEARLSDLGEIVSVRVQGEKDFVALASHPLMHPQATLDLGALHAKLQPSFAELLRSGREHPLSRLPYHVKLEFPGGKSLRLGVSRPDASNPSFLPMSLFLQVLAAADAAWRRFDADGLLQPAPQDIELATALLAELLADCGSKEPAELSDALHGDREQRLGVAMLLGGDAVREDVAKLQAVAPMLGRAEWSSGRFSGR